MWISVAIVTVVVATQGVLSQFHPPGGQYPPPPGQGWYGGPRPPFRYPPQQPQAPTHASTNHWQQQSYTEPPKQPQGPIDWRMCYVCSGMFPDRECELYPKYVTKGPGKINCTRSFCTSFVRYMPKKHLLEKDDKKLNPRALSPEDFEVDSIARECEDVDRGNKCEFDGDKKALTCYATCKEDYCNDVTPSPSLKDFGKDEPTDEMSKPEDKMMSDKPYDGPDNRRGYEPPAQGGDKRTTDDGKVEGSERPPYRGPPPFLKRDKDNMVDQDMKDMKGMKEGGSAEGGRRGRKGGPRFEGGPNGNKTMSTNRRGGNRRRGGKQGDAASLGAAGNSTASAHSVNFQPISSFVYSFCLVSGLFVFNVGAFSLNQ